MSETSTTAATTGAGEVLAHLRAQRAHRKLLPNPVADDLIEEILTAATWAPSASNTQPWEWVVVTDPDVKGRLAAVNRAAWEGGGRAISEDRLPGWLFRDVDEWATTGLIEAPVVIVACANLDRVGDISASSSVFPAVQNLLLAAQAHGLGTVLTTLPVAGGPGPVAEILGLPERVRPMAVVPMGYPARTLGPSKRIPVATKTHRDQYGTPW